MSDDVWADSDLEARVRDDFAAVLGREFFAAEVMGYADDTSDSLEVTLQPPARVRVVASEEFNDLLRWQDDFLDPLWNVELLEHRPELAGGHGWYVYGTSYGRHGEVEAHVLREVAASK